MDQFLLIKAISALLYPIGLVFVLAILAWVFSRLRRRKLARLAKLLSVLVLILASNPMVAKWSVSSLERQYPPRSIDEIKKHDVILVLGGGLNTPLSPTSRTQIGSHSDRYWFARQLFKAAKADKIILSGGNLYEQPKFQGEAYYAAQLLQEWGVPKSAIEIETSSRNTEQNLHYSANYLNNAEIESMLLVTSAFHMPRALRLFKVLPIRVTPASADILVRKQNAPSIFNWIPSSSAISLTTLAAHEYYGAWFSALKAWIGKF